MSKGTASARKQERLLTQGFGLVVLAGLVVIVGVYLFTGVDLFGLFAEEAPDGGAVTQETAAAQEPAIVTPPHPTTAPKPTEGQAIEDWWEVYFVEPNSISNPGSLAGPIPERLIALINGAEQTIHIASFEFDLTPVAEALITAHKRGVQVLWLTDDEFGIDADDDVGHGQFAMLLDAGIEIRYDDRSGLMHDKFWLFDAETVWTGSTNITESGITQQNNNVLVIHAREVALMYERQFKDMWIGGLGARSSISTVDQQAVEVAGTPVQVLFSPEDDVMDHLIPLVEGAQESIRFMAFAYTQPALAEAMLARATAGVDVAGIFERTGSETEYSAMPTLYCAEVSVRQDGNPSFLHHKVIVIDDEIVITGSLNFTDNANTSNNENVVVVYNQEIARLYLEEFDARWSEALEPDAAKMNCKK